MGFKEQTFSAIDFSGVSTRAVLAKPLWLAFAPTALPWHHYTNLEMLGILDLTLGSEVVDVLVAQGDTELLMRTGVILQDYLWDNDYPSKDLQFTLVTHFIHRYTDRNGATLSGWRKSSTALLQAMGLPDAYKERVMVTLYETGEIRKDTKFITFHRKVVVPGTFTA